MKKWYQSKTIWFNSLTIIVAFATFMGYTPNEQLANDVTGVLLISAPVINMVLRAITKKEVSL